MNLCFDIGNTLIKYAIIDDLNNIVYRDESEQINIAFLRNLTKEYNIRKAGIVASGKVDSYLHNYLTETYPLLIVNEETPLPLKISYRTPETLGRDRIAAAIGGKSLFPGENICIITLGTCITYNIVDESGTFLGGNISPGVGIRFKAMHDYTANLPLVNPAEMINLLGGSTEEAMQNGVMYGTLFEIESFIVRIKEKFNKINIILTGGDAFYFANKINSKIFVNSDAVLLGLNEIINFNA